MDLYADHDECGRRLADRCSRRFRNLPHASPSSELTDETLSHRRPGLLARALKHGVEDLQLPETDVKGWIFNMRGAISDRSIKPPEDLFERVVVAFAVAAGEIGIRPRPISQ